MAKTITVKMTEAQYNVLANAVDYYWTVLDEEKTVRANGQKGALARAWEAVKNGWNGTNVRRTV